MFRKIYGKMNYAVFLVRGKKPWSRGYIEYRKAEIKRAIAEGSFDPIGLPSGYGHRLDERIIEYPWLFSRIPSGKGRLLDAGSVLNFGFILEEKRLADKEIFISTLAPEDECFWEKGISYIYEDLRETCYRDGYFDWIVSLSTIEHIGLDNTMLYTNDETKKENRPDDYLDAIREFRRILKPGGVLYLSVPFGKYRNHGWFQVFDSRSVDALIKAFQPSVCREDHFRYEPQGWKVSSRVGSREAACFDIHRQKNYDPDNPAFSGAVVCLEMVK